MKKLIRVFIVLACMAVTLVSCEKEIEPQNEPNIEIEEAYSVEGENTNTIEKEEVVDPDDL